MKNKTTKRWLFAGIATILLLTVGMLYFTASHETSHFKDYVVLDDVEITEIFIYEKFASLEVLMDEEPKGITLQLSTDIYDQNGKHIFVENLEVGQHIKAYVNPTMQYEPYDTYMVTYKIFLL